MTNLSLTILTLCVAGGPIAHPAHKVAEAILVNALDFGHQSGPLVSTGGPTDLVILGPGFFKLNYTSGKTAYSRLGDFKLLSGRLTNSDGGSLSLDISLPAGTSQVRVDQDGFVSAFLPGRPERMVVGHIQIATFAKQFALRRIAQDRFIPTDLSGNPTFSNPVDGNLHNNFVELPRFQVLGLKRKSVVKNP